MHQHITVDGIGPCVRTLCGRKRAADIAAFTQDVVPLQRYRGGIPFQEALRKLRVPNQLIGIHGRVVVTTAAALPDIRGQTHVPRHVDLHIAPVRKAVSVKIGILLQIITCMLVVDVTVHAHFKQIITEIEIRPFANIGTLRRALLAKVHDLVGSHVVVDLRTGTDVPYIIGITESCKCEKVEVLLLPHRSVEHKPCPSVPIAVDVHRHGGTPSRSLIVKHSRTDAVVGHAHVRMHHPSTLQVGYVIVVEQFHTVGPRRLQPRVTFRDVQRVGVVCHVEQVRH